MQGKIFRISGLFRLFGLQDPTSFTAAQIPAHRSPQVHHTATNSQERPGLEYQQPPLLPTAMAASDRPSTLRDSGPQPDRQPAASAARSAAQPRTQHTDDHYSPQNQLRHTASAAAAAGASAHIAASAAVLSVCQHRPCLCDLPKRTPTHSGKWPVAVPAQRLWLTAANRTAIPAVSGLQPVGPSRQAARNDCPHSSPRQSCRRS